VAGWIYSPLSPYIEVLMKSLYLTHSQVKALLKLIDFYFQFRKMPYKIGHEEVTEFDISIQAVRNFLMED
jgi:hypothetical protein